MVIEYIRYEIPETQRVAFTEAYQKAVSYLDDSEYCLGYELTECEEKPQNLILRIEWTSTQDHLSGFRKSSDFSKFLAYVRPFIENILEMNHYQLTTITNNKRNGRAKQ